MHKQFLLAALDQALLGRGFCAPNPSVGAVAVQHGKIIAQSWHRGAGTPHAESLLLEKIPKNNPDITIYVTLEPCNHWGKTPPCVDAIIEHGIKKVVYAYADPNPVVSVNNTPNLLKKHGITVVHHPLAEVDKFYQSYRYWTFTHKPWVTAKIAQSFDGKIAAEHGTRAFISNTLCASFTHEHRKRCDIILTTARTVNQDDPLLNARTPGCEVSKPIAIIDRQLTLNPRAQLLTRATHCHIYYDANGNPPSNLEPADKLLETGRNNCTYHPISCTSGLLDLKAVIEHLGYLGFHDVWVEAGGALFTELHKAGLVNRTYVYLVPKILGQTAISAYGNTDIFNNAQSVTWQAMGDNMIAKIDWDLQIN